MTSRLPRHLHDALTAARHATEFLGELDRDGYLANALVRSAVERQLVILGEACKRALDDTPALAQRIPEPGLAVGLRNRLIHGYDKVVHDVAIETVRHELPRPRIALEAELERFPLP